MWHHLQKHCLWGQLNLREELEGPGWKNGLISVVTVIDAVGLDRIACGHCHLMT